MRINNAQNMTESDFFPAENAGNMAEIAILANFHWIFSICFFVFSLKDVIDL